MLKKRQKEPVMRRWFISGENLWLYDAKTGEWRDTGPVRTIPDSREKPVVPKGAARNVAT
jgi:hypothetical protein